MNTATATATAADLNDLPTRRQIKQRMQNEQTPPTAAEVAALRRELETLRNELQAAHIPRQFYTVKQAAQFLDVKPATVYQYLLRGVLQKQPTPGRRVFIAYSDLVRYITGKEPEQPTTNEPEKGA